MRALLGMLAPYLAGATLILLVALGITVKIAWGLDNQLGAAAGQCAAQRQADAGVQKDAVIAQQQQDLKIYQAKEEALQKSLITANDAHNQDLVTIQSMRRRFQVTWSKEPHENTPQYTCATVPLPVDIAERLRAQLAADRSDSSDQGKHPAPTGSR